MKANHDVDDELTRKRIQKRASKPWQWNSTSSLYVSIQIIVWSIFFLHLSEIYQRVEKGKPGNSKACKTNLNLIQLLIVVQHKFSPTL
jgi:hypothetical protein